MNWTEVEAVLPRQGTDRRDRSWDAPTLHYYLVDIGKLAEDNRGPRNPFTLPMHRYPLDISLNDRMHRIYDYMGRRSQVDNHERWMPIGHSSYTDLLYFPKHFVKALRANDRSVNLGDIQRVLNEAAALGIECEAGELHSHPRHPENQQPANEHHLFDNKGPRLSYGDFYCLIAPIRRSSVLGLAEGDVNIMAFRSEETIDIAAGDPIDSQAKFDRYCTSANASNVDVAAAFNIVLYQGATGERLQRVFPRQHT